MYFRKFHHPLNFVSPERVDARTGTLRFRRRSVTTAITAYGNDVFRFEATGPGWERSHSLAGLTPSRTRAGDCALGFAKDGSLALTGPDGKALIRTRPRRPLAAKGEGWMLDFVPDEAMRFFGLGENNLGWEKKRIRTKFWNTDVAGDFVGEQITNATNDPAYVAIPYLAIKRGDTWFGILVENPDAVFVGLPNFDEGKPGATFFCPPYPTFHVGSPAGKPVVWFLVGPTLAELTRKLQRLCGETPLPPLWSLGHQQCRWGYKEAKELHELERLYRRHRIPNDGLWLDIDYMERFQVFTWSKQLWKNPGKEVRGVAATGHPVVPILDPGVMVEKGYHAYESGLRAGAFCLTEEGEPYTGFVWPGPTHFPDFSVPAGREWWAGQVARWVRDSGVGGAWLDMNDPSVGSAELDPMRFDKGRLPHSTHHNQFALGMAIASRAGFLAADPDKRPFLIARSGSTGSSRHTAIWTGDNCSNWKHLRISIPTSLALAISGVPFNGPDVPGFAGSPDDELAAAWYKAGFLFPFFRNHCDLNSRHQEPWTFRKPTVKVIATCIRLRYKLLPYIYNLWIDQEERGEAVMRPLCYDHADGPGQDLAAVGDQFCLGPALLHAPVLDQGADSRRVVLPPGWWYALSEGRWIRGGRTITVRQGRLGTPLYVREGSIVPMQVGERTSHVNDLADIELHAFVRPGGSASCSYRWDDGATFAYRSGKRSGLAAEVRLAGTTATVRIASLAGGAGKARVRVVVHGPCRKIALDADRTVAVKRVRVDLLGCALPAAVSAPLRVG